MGDPLGYDAVGATQPASATWPATPAAYRRHERTTLLGHGQACWDDVAAQTLRWGVKTRSGFSVTPSGPVREGRDHTLTAHLGPLRVHEPVRVVAVVDREDRCGFAYGTRAGHPVSGEEAFVVHRSPDGAVHLTLRSLTRPAPGVLHHLAYPALLLAQRWYRTRYARALRQR